MPNWIFAGQDVFDAKFEVEYYTIPNTYLVIFVIKKLTKQNSLNLYRTINV